MLASTLSFGLFATACSGKGAGPKRPPLELARQIVQVQMAAVKADSALLQDMETVADAFMRFAKARRRFPDDGKEALELADRMARLLPDNPYFTDANLAQCIKQEGMEGAANQPSVTIVQDLRLSFTQFDELKFAPPSAWHGNPGSIYVIHNAEDTFIVWGASANGMPVKNADSGTVQILMRHINR